MVTIIAKTIVDLDTLLLAGNNFLEENLVSKYDDLNKKVGGIDSYLTCLEKLNKYEKFDLRHINYSFLVIASRETLTELLHYGRLYICSKQTKNPDLYMLIVSANLEIWKQAIIDLTHYVKEIRILVNKCKILFEREGLYLWNECNQVNHTDGSFILNPFKERIK